MSGHLGKRCTQKNDACKITPNINLCNMVRILKRGESRVTFYTVKCFFTGEGFHTKKKRACIPHGTVETANCLTATYRMSLCKQKK